MVTNWVDACRWLVSFAPVLLHGLIVVCLCDAFGITFLANSSDVPSFFARYTFCPGFGRCFCLDGASSALCRIGSLVSDLRRRPDALLYRIDGSCKNLSGPSEQRDLLQQFHLHGHWYFNSLGQCRLHALGERSRHTSLLMLQCKN